MSAQHTPGRLTLVTQYAQPELRDASGELVAVIPAYEVENARRLATCWNACDGIDTEHLERHGLPDFAQKISDLVAQRDALRDAAKNALNALQICGMKFEHVEAELRAAIAKADEATTPAQQLQEWGLLAPQPPKDEPAPREIR